MQRSWSWYHSWYGDSYWSSGTDTDLLVDRGYILLVSVHYMYNFKRYGRSCNVFVSVCSTTFFCQVLLRCLFFLGGSVRWKAAIHAESTELSYAALSGWILPDFVVYLIRELLQESIMLLSLPITRSGKKHVLKLAGTVETWSILLCIALSSTSVNLPLL